MIKVIKTDSDYEAALTAVDRLLQSEPEPGTKAADELEVLTVLVEDYERSITNIGLPDPISAIEFRMEQQGLRQTDLVPYLGSRSKVSEILSGKRSLTLNMIRALHGGLGIPAEVLLQDRDPELLEPTEIEWVRFPVREMVKRQWITQPYTNLRDEAEDLLRPFFATIGGARMAAALYRKSRHVRAARPMNHYALTAWTAQILRRVVQERPQTEFHRDAVNLAFMQTVARLSWSDTGPLLAREYLRKHGIPLIIERHLTGTFLDGAAVFSSAIGAPVVALTLRHDRIDNFWFCLMHELAHVGLHLEEGGPDFFDDLDVTQLDDQMEREADKMAGEALIPEEAWRRSPASRLRSPEAAEALAAELGIHSAIVAGRVRHENESYRQLSHMVGRGKVRKLFYDSKGVQDSV